MVVLGTSLYLAIAGWTHGNLLENELKRFRIENDQFRSPSPEQALRMVDPRWDDGDLSRLEALVQRKFGGPLQISGASSLSRVAARLHEPTTTRAAQINSIRDDIRSAIWVVEVVDSIDTDWRGLQNEISAVFGQRPFNVRPSFEFTVLQWPSNGSRCHGQLTLLQPTPYLTRGEQDRLQLHATRAFSCHTRLQRIAAQPDFFAARYPVITEFWDSVATLSPSKAEAWARHLKTPELNGSKSTIAGLTFEGKYVAIVSPLMLVAMLLYMQALIVNLLHSRPYKTDELAVLSVSPWLGTMGNYWARAVVWGSLVALPFISTTVLLWNQRHFPLLWSALAGVAVAGLGVLCTQSAMRLSQSTPGTTTDTTPSGNAPPV